MKYLKLKEIVEEYADALRESAAYSGAWDDGGYSALHKKLHDYKNTIVVKYDLRPSEFSKIDDIEVDEPEVFADVIKKYKLELANNIIKNIKL